MAFTVSIVVPVFRTEDHLPGCLQSLLDQTYQQFEIVVVDDCSPGPCANIVNDFRQFRPNIKYIRHHRNLGLLVTRFTGARQSSGDYIGYLDSDDRARPNFVEILLEMANKTGVDIIGSLNSLSKARKPVEFALKGSKALFEAYTNKDIQNYNVWTKLYRRELLMSIDDLGSIAEKKRMDSPEDLLINVFCALKEPSYVNVPQILVEYNSTRDGSLTNIKDDHSIIRDLRGRLDAYDLLRSVSGAYTPCVEQLIQRSVNYVYRRKMAKYAIGEFKRASKYMVEQRGGPILLTYILHVAESDRRALEKKLKAQSSKLNKLESANRSLKTWRGVLGVIREKLGLS
jgi:glycosyltransferase involved in cell wall biosynthesis